MVYTSGTTGRPKGVMHPTFDPQAGFESQKRTRRDVGLRTPDDVHLVVGPAYHTMPNAYAAQHLFVGRDGRDHADASTPGSACG